MTFLQANYFGLFPKDDKIMNIMGYILEFWLQVLIAGQLRLHPEIPKKKERQLK